MDPDPRQDPDPTAKTPKPPESDRARTTALILAAFLGLLGLLPGGCSLLLTGVAFDYGLMEFDLLVILLWLSGIGLCLFLLNQAFVLWRTWR